MYFVTAALLISAVLLAGRPSVAKSKPVMSNLDADQQVIAVVDGTPITRKEVNLDPALPGFALEARFGHIAKTSADKNAALKIEHGMKLRRLSRRIRQVIWDEQFNQFGIKISDDQVRHRWEALWRDWNLEAVIKQQHDFDKILWQAVKLVYEQGVNPDDAYSRLLAQRIPKALWHIQLERFQRPEERKRFQEKLARTPEYYHSHYELGREWVRQEEMNKAVDHELERSDPEFAKYEVLMKSPGPQRGNASYLIEQARDQWWITRYKKASIQIKDRNYEDVLTVLFMPRYQLPLSIQQIDKTQSPQHASN